MILAHGTLVKFFAQGTLVKFKDESFKKPFTTYPDPSCMSDGNYVNPQDLNGHIAEIIESEVEYTTAYLPYLNRFVNCFTYRFEQLPKET